MESIFIPHIPQAPERTVTIEFKEFLADFASLTPVQGWLKVIHKGNYLEVSAEVDTIITLSCPRCLQQFNYRLSIAPAEMIWLNDQVQPEEELFDQDLSMDELMETLSPNGHFDPTQWIYEQLSLEIPQRQLCQQDCEGIEVDLDSTVVVDRRWAALDSLKGKFPST
jgi:uncharacterized protein